jgi:hypothetical protein
VANQVICATDLRINSFDLRGCIRTMEDHTDRSRGELEEYPLPSECNDVTVNPARKENLGGALASVCNER